jgi:hypothetical protein|tara:strand:+ start:905 stop:1204 length:300 start_codon:yes stop_codon:yes gene_type:complete
MEHIALMGKIVNRPMPLSMARQEAARSFFDRAGNIRWPERAPSTSSREYVGRTRPLAEIVRAEDASFASLCSGLLELNPRERLTTTEALTHPFVRQGRQ